MIIRRAPSHGICNKLKHLKSPVMSPMCCILQRRTFSCLNVNFSATICKYIRTVGVIRPTETMTKPVSNCNHPHMYTSPKCYSSFNSNMNTLFLPRMNRPCNYSAIHGISTQLKCQALYSILYCTYATKVNNVLLRDYLTSLEIEYNSLTEDQSTGVVLDYVQKIRIQQLYGPVTVYQQIRQKYNEVEELNQMLTAEDAEIRSLAEEEKKICQKEIEDLERNVVEIMVPEENTDHCDIILEVECGAGGQESMLFAQSIFHMYLAYSIYKGWVFTILEKVESDKGGYNTASASISGTGVYGELKYEGGVHRVQRVPKTERGGRIHTSTMTVAIIPQPSDIDIVINQSDIKTDVFKSSGPGGQSVQKNDTAVRVTHIPTGTIVTCQESRSQHRNIDTAMRILKSRMYESVLRQQQSGSESLRKIQVGRKDRSEKIRTYNFQQDRITDHRIKLNVGNMEEFLAGGKQLESMINELITASKQERLEIMLQEFQKSRKTDEVKKQKQ